MTVGGPDNAYRPSPSPPETIRESMVSYWCPRVLFCSVSVLDAGRGRV